MREIALAGLLVAVFVGCGREEISVYRVPKETNRLAAPAPPAVAVDRSSQPLLQWGTIPDGWKEGSPSSMRVASFVVEGDAGQQAEISITPLPGATDIEMSSLNMWRGEVGLPPANSPTALNTGTEVRIGGLPARLYDLAGISEGQPARIAGAMLVHGGATWFFKMRGADSLVASQKSAFTEFLKTVSFAESAPAWAAAPKVTPAAASRVAPSSASNLPQWEVPAHWQPQASRSMVLAVFAVPGGGSQAEVAISSFPGDVGGLRANVDRWRRQLSLGPASDAELSQSTSPLEVNGVTATVVDMKNDASGERTVAVILPHGGNSWFFKLTGPDAVLSDEKAGFIKFVQSVRFSSDA